MTATPDRWVFLRSGYQLSISLALNARPETKQELTPKATQIQWNRGIVFTSEKQEKISKSRYPKTANLCLKYLSLDYAMFLPHLVRNFQEIGVFMLSANMIITVQGMKPVKCLRKKVI